MKSKFLFFFFLFFLLPLNVYAGDHDLYTGLLNDHVVDGMVNYKMMCSDARLGQYISQLSQSDPAAITEGKARLAFWLNAYNAYTLKIICDNYPLKSINELHSGGLAVGMILKTTVWDKKLVVINNEKTSLSDIEHKIIRSIFKDPRIHFAIVCAAKGCPSLRNEAFEAENLDQQLDDQGRIFIAEANKNSFNFKTRTANISPIFSWFKKDFGTRPEAVLRFIARYLPEEGRKILSQDAAGWKIKYTFYDWSLNER